MIHQLLKKPANYYRQHTYLDVLLLNPEALDERPLVAPAKSRVADVVRHSVVHCKFSQESVWTDTSCSTTTRVIARECLEFTPDTSFRERVKADT